MCYESNMLCSFYSGNTTCFTILNYQYNSSHIERVKLPDYSISNKILSKTIFKKICGKYKRIYIFLCFYNAEMEVACLS